jgi:hypothetical protein
MNLAVPEERLGELLLLLKERSAKQALPDAALAALARDFLTTRTGGDPRTGRPAKGGDRSAQP